MPLKQLDMAWVIWILISGDISVRFALSDIFDPYKNE